MSELLLRIASAVVLVAVALATAWIGGWPFALVWSVAGAVVAHEWVTMARVEPARRIRLLIPALAAACGLGAAAAPGWVLLYLAAGMLAAAALAAGAIRERLWATGGFLYAAVIAIVPVLVRLHSELGLVGLAWMFAVVWATDIGGFFAGRTIGGPKLWARVSPKKTWAGMIGGTLAGVLASLALLTLLPPTLGTGLALGLATAASLASQIGDLAESALKRHWGVKDSGWLIPGHGGFMDRLDGFWAVSVLAALVLIVQGLGS